MQTPEVIAKANSSISTGALVKAKKHRDKMLRRIERAHADGKPALVRRLTTDYFKSHDAHIVATLDAYRKIKPHLRPAYSAIPEIAESLDPWKGTQEAAHVSYVKKPNGDRRLIQDFGIENRALQRLVGSVLAATSDLHPHQYATRGGLHAAVRCVRDCLLEGYLWAVETDLVNCFGSFDGKKVPGLLSISEEVTRHVILPDHFNLLPGNLHTLFGPPDDNGNEMIMTANALAEARLGLPQGSSTSSVAVEIMLAPVFQDLPASGVAVGFADNTLTMAKTESDVVTITKALWSALKAHPAGPLSPKIVGGSEPGCHLDYLGHRFRKVDDQVLIRPAPEHENRFNQTVKRKIARIKQADKSAKQEAGRDLRRYIASWTSAFSMCSGMEDFRNSVLS